MVEKNKTIPLECAQIFYNRYSEICEIVVFVDADHDIPLFNTLELANHLNEDLV